MKQPTVAKEQVKNSHLAMQWLIWQVAKVSRCTKGMGNNTIKTHLALHLCKDILDHGVPDNVNSAYAESAHIPLAKMTSRNTQKQAVSFTKQAAHRYVENLVVTLASADVANDVELMGSWLDTPSPTAAPADAQPSGVMAGRHGQPVTILLPLVGTERDRPMIQTRTAFSLGDRIPVLTLPAAHAQQQASVLH